MEESICRFCLTRCLNFKIVERTYYGTLNMLLPSLNLEVSREPVVCKSCSEIMKKYLTFKTMSLDIRNVPDIRDVCLFCKNSITLITVSFLKSQDTDMYLLRTMMNQYFPELDLQVNADTFIICSVCRRSIQKIFDFLVKWQDVEQHIEKYCQSVGIFGKGDIDLKSVMYYREPTVESKDDSIVQLAADQFIKQEPSEEDSERYITEENEKIFLPVTEVKENDNFVGVNVKLEVENENGCEDTIKATGYKPREVLNENSVFLDQKHNLEPKAVAIEEAFSETHGGRIKVEQVWLKQEGSDIKSTNDDIDHLRESVSEEEIKFPSTGDHLRDSIDRVVRRWANYEPIKDGSKPTEDPKEEEKAPKVNREKSNIVAKPLSEDIKAKMLHKRRWWTNTAVVNRPSTQYFSKTELRAMISRIQVSGEKKYQCQVCQFITSDKCSMNRHMKFHQDPSELETLECHNCGYKTKSKSNLKTHMMTHRDRSQMPVHQCQYCPFSTKSKNNLRWHLVKHDAATNVTKFECYTCGFKACRKFKLIGHMSKHRRKGSEPVAKTHRCEYCGFETKYSSTISKHLESHREPVKCIHCKFKTKYNATIKRHLRRVHNVQVGRREIDLINALLTEPVAVE